MNDPLYLNNVVKYITLYKIKKLHLKVKQGLEKDIPTKYNNNYRLNFYKSKIYLAYARGTYFNL